MNLIEAFIVLLLIGAIGGYILYKMVTWAMPGIIHDPEEVKRKDLQKELQTIQAQLNELKEK